MGLCVGDVDKPRWLALTEGTLSWSMPTGLRFMSFILVKKKSSLLSIKNIFFKNNNLSLTSPRSYQHLHPKQHLLLRYRQD